MNLSLFPLQTKIRQTVQLQIHFSIQVQLTLLINGSCGCVEGSWNNQAQCQGGKSFPCFSQNSQFIVVLLTRPVSEIFDLSLCFPFSRFKLGFKVEVITMYFSLYTSFTFLFYLVQIDHLHYDVIRAKPDGSCSRPAETGPSVL